MKRIMDDSQIDPNRHINKYIVEYSACGLILVNTLFTSNYQNVNISLAQFYTTKICGLRIWDDITFYYEKYRSCSKTIFPSLT